MRNPLRSFSLGLVLLVAAGNAHAVPRTVLMEKFTNTS